MGNAHIDTGGPGGHGLALTTKVTVLLFVCSGERLTEVLYVITF